MKIEARAASDIRIRFQPMRQEVVAVASETVSVNITIQPPLGTRGRAPTTGPVATILPRSPGHFLTDLAGLVVA